MQNDTHRKENISRIQFQFFLNHYNLLSCLRLSSSFLWRIFIYLAPNSDKNWWNNNKNEEYREKITCNHCLLKCKCNFEEFENTETNEPYIERELKEQLFDSKQPNWIFFSFYHTRTIKRLSNIYFIFSFYDFINPWRRCKFCSMTLFLYD